MARPRKTELPSVVAALCAGPGPTKTLKGASWWELCQEYPDTEGVTVYLYRIKPIIDRQRLGKAKNIGKYPLVNEKGERMLTERALVQEHGSGAYKYQFVDDNRPQQFKLVATGLVEIEQTDERQPVVEPEDLVLEDPRNAAYLQWCRAHFAHFPGDDEMPQSEGTSGVAAMASLNRILLQELHNERRQPAGKDPIELAIAAENAFSGRKEMEAARADNLAMMKAMFDNQIALATLQLDQASKGKPQSDLTQLREIMGLAKEIGGGGGGSDWGAIAGAVPGIIAGVVQLVDRLIAARTGAPAPAAAGPPAVRWQPAVPAPIGASGGPADSAEEPEMNLDQLADLGRKALAAIDNGVSGDEFASALYTLAPELYDLLAKKGKAQILAALRSQAKAWQEVAPRAAAVERFLDEFLAYGEPEPEGQAGPDTAGAVPAGGGGT